MTQQQFEVTLTSTIHHSYCCAIYSCTKYSCTAAQLCITYDTPINNRLCCHVTPATGITLVVMDHPRYCCTSGCCSTVAYYLYYILVYSSKCRTIFLFLVFDFVFYLNKTGRMCAFYHEYLFSLSRRQSGVDHRPKQKGIRSRLHIIEQYSSSNEIPHRPIFKSSITCSQSRKGVGAEERRQALEPSRQSIDRSRELSETAV